MAKHINVAKSWTELNRWQLEEIVDLYLHPKEENLLKMVFILFQKKKGFWYRWKLYMLTRNVPISELSKFADFLLEPPKLHQFPEIERLKKPADRLGDLSIKQFSFMDQFFHGWMESKSDKMLRALVASIYRDGNIFDELKLIGIAEKTDKLTRKQRQVIGFIYMSCYHHLTEQFPAIYPKPKGDDKKEKKKVKHTPFSEIIISIVMNDEQQPLGNLHESHSTRIYDFMNVFTKILIKQEKLAKDAKRK